jgi:hypothetical protein
MHETGKQHLDGRPAIEHSSRQAFPEEPDVACVGHSVVQPEAQKAHEREPVVDQILRPLVGEPVRGLDHEDFEHHHRIKRRATTLCSVHIGQPRIQGGAEDLKIHRRGKGLDWTWTPILEDFL